jgi:hypothetical protein
MEAGESKCSGGGDGYTSSYSPSVTAGVLDVYTSAPASAAGMQCSSSDDTTATDDNSGSDDTTGGSDDAGGSDDNSGPGSDDTSGSDDAASEEGVDAATVATVGTAGFALLAALFF